MDSLSAGVGLSWIMPEQAQGVRVTKEWSGAQNPYAHFGECNIWPRGFPLDTILQEGLQACQPLQGGSMEPSAKGVFAPVQQGLADLVSLVLVQLVMHGGMLAPENFRNGPV